jgi:ABC-type amino acid transport substrate-binding protein
VAKDRQPLHDAVHGALERVLASGRYAQVLARWNVSGAAPWPHRR